MPNGEYLLAGGNMSKVSTDGHVVYKDRKPQSHTVQRLLLHLQSKGIDFCPRPMGFDGEGREMLSYVSGHAIEDYPQVSDLQQKVASVARMAVMLRKLHDATIDFQTQSDDCWYLKYEGELPAEVICHNDIAPYNVTFENDLPVGIIDFDTACPAPRVWDIAYAVYRFVPLSQSVYDCKLGGYRDYDPAKDCMDRRQLLKTFLDSYGYDGAVEPYVIQRLQALVTLFDVQCAKGDPAFLKMRKEGHQDFYIKEIKFIKRHFVRWQ